MRATGLVSRALLFGLLVSLAAAAFPEAAAADRDSHRRKKHWKRHRHEVVVVERGCAARAHRPVYYVPPPPPPPVYFDASCGRSFRSFELYFEHMHRHGRVAIAFGTGWRDRGGVRVVPRVVERRHRCDDEDDD
jgi:hypothetical protein